MVTFEPLPEIPNNRRAAAMARNAADAAALRERPDEWAHVTTKPSHASAVSFAHQIRNGITAAYRPAGSYEAMKRTVESEHRVYARYVGPTT
jgi:hypothetical protein